MPGDDVIIRPLEPGDVAAADRVADAALDEVIARPTVDEAERARRGQLRIAHLQKTDPEGCWVAELDGEVVAVALSLIREGIWGFSLFGVRPDVQRRRIGTRVFEPCLRYAERARGGIILSTTHPAAMRRYALAGFALHPVVSAAGVLDRRALPSGLRAQPGRVDDERDRETAATASRHVRGASHDRDLEMFVAVGCEFLVIDDEGWAMHRNGHVMTIAATNEDAAIDLLWSCLAATPPGGSVEVDFITSAQQWPLGPCLASGLALSPDGPVFTRGTVGPMTPYIPGGAYL